MEVLNLLLNMALIVLIGTMIFFVVRLHNRLEVIRSGKEDLETLLSGLVGATTRAELGLRDLRDRAEELTGTLGKYVTGAENARDELSQLLASADRNAAELFRAVEQARQVTANVAPPATARKAAPVAVEAKPATAPVAAAELAAEKPDTRRQAEHDLLKAIENLR
jgi:hypothetical protein